MINDVVQLTAEFYNDYSEEKYPEILRKESRPYSCVVVKIKNYILCIPFRSEMKHNIGYPFKNSVRSVEHRSGLDFTKMVVIKDFKYISNVTVVDRDEYIEFIDNLNRIESQAIRYVNKYVDHCTGIKKMNNTTFEKRYGYSCLLYFHKELGIENVSVTDPER